MFLCYTNKNSFLFGNDVQSFMLVDVFVRKNQDYFGNLSKIVNGVAYILTHYIGGSSKVIT